MKLTDFEIKEKYLFSFTFEDGTQCISDIKDLISSKVTEDEIKTARVDTDWGCLEFKDGLVDIEPKTLYNFSIQHSKLSA